MNILCLISLLTFSLPCLAQTLFTVRKNFSPENVFVYRAHVKDCRFVKPYVSGYWFNTVTKKIEEAGFLEGHLINPVIRRQSAEKIEFSNHGADLVKLRPDEKIMIAKFDANCTPKTFNVLDGVEYQLVEAFLDVTLPTTLNSMKVNGYLFDGKPYQMKINF